MSQKCLYNRNTLMIPQTVLTAIETKKIFFFFFPPNQKDLATAMLFLTHNNIFSHS